MKDQDKFVGLGQILAHDRRQQSVEGAQIETIRVQLEAIAGKSAAKYQHEVEATRPEAQTAISHVIQPWFSELVSTGTYAELLERSSSHKEDVPLSDTILYYWPEDALKALAKGERPYADTAKYVAENYKGQDIQRGIQTHADNDEVWYAGFHLQSNEWKKPEGVRIWRRPVVGMGYGFAMIAREYDIHVNVLNVEASLDSISPEVWMKFGQQIETGRIWEVIDQSMKPRKVRVLTAKETQEGREADNRRSAEYFRTRQWH